MNGWKQQSIILSQVCNRSRLLISFSSNKFASRLCFLIICFGGKKKESEYSRKVARTYPCPMQKAQPRYVVVCTSIPINHNNHNHEMLNIA